ncbi:MFS transporter [candidate division KSB1 bacterium 4572_119]|nr:MAG: MFS transporter [candidate division KSB1 bacterium 4572_119]
MINLLKFFSTGKDKPLIKNSSEVNRLFRRYRISAISAVTLGAGFAYTCRLALSIIKKPLIDGGIFSAEQLGLIGSAIFYGYAFGKFFNGVLADYANIKKFFATGVLFSAIINMLMGWSSLLWLWIVLWGLNGWFQGFNAPSGIVTLSNWFSNNERGRYYGIWATAHGIGEGLTLVGVAALVNHLGWRYGFWGPSVLGVLTAVGLYTFLNDRPQTLGLPSVADWRNDHGVEIAQKKTGTKQTLLAQLTILKLPTVWLIGLASAMIYMTRYAITSWGVLYLQEAKGYSLLEAGSIIGVNTVAGIAGSLAYGFISDKFFNARRPPANLIYAVMELFALYIIFFYPGTDTKLLVFAFILYGFTLHGLVAALGGLFAVDIAPKKAAGAAMGFVGIFSYVAAAIQEQISGTLIDDSITIVNGIKQYDFSNLTIFWAGSSVLSLIFALTLWKVKPAD